MEKQTLPAAQPLMTKTDYLSRNSSLLVKMNESKETRPVEEQKKSRKLSSFGWHLLFCQDNATQLGSKGQISTT